VKDLTSTYFFLKGISKMKRSFGLLLLAIWLIFTGLAHLLHLSFSGMATLMAVIATTAGVLILMGL
jgi:hypothetical protein